PAAVTGDLLASGRDTGELSQTLLGLPYSFMNALWGALTVAFFFLAASRGERARAPGALAASVLFGLCSLNWAYAHSDANEPAVTACLMIAYVVLGWTELGWGLLGSGLLGFALLIKVTAVLAWPAILIHAARARQ